MQNSLSTRGRPKDPKREAKVKTNMIKAASQALKKKLYSEISIREIATKAGVNSAMISYHFGSKEGLFFAVIQQGIGEGPLNSLIQLAENTALQPEQKLHKLITIFVSTHQQHPWLSRLIVDQIIMKKGKLRDLFVKNIVSNHGIVIERLIKQFIADGYFRENMNTEFTRISLMSLLAFPFICAPMLEQAFEMDFYQQDIDTWVDHTLTLFLDGCKNRHAN